MLYLSLIDGEAAQLNVFLFDEVDVQRGADLLILIILMNLLLFC